MTRLSVDFRCGSWENALRGVEPIDALISDPPFSKRTHDGQRHGRKDARYSDTRKHPILSSRGHGFIHWGEKEIARFVRYWEPKTLGWFCVHTSHDLIWIYKRELELCGRYVFAPIPCVQLYSNVRLAGDGPSNWTSYLVVSRRRLTKGSQRWGALPGAYVGKCFDQGENALDRSKRICTGAKPEWMMRAIIRDYSRPGDLVCDPCAGGATTLIAAFLEGRRSVGSEKRVEIYKKACVRIASAESTFARLEHSQYPPPRRAIRGTPETQCAE
jgi:hypothetical protein